MYLYHILTLAICYFCDNYCKIYVSFPYFVFGCCYFCDDVEKCLRFGRLWYYACCPPVRQKCQVFNLNFCFILKAVRKVR